MSRKMSSSFLYMVYLVRSNSVWIYNKIPSFLIHWFEEINVVRDFKFLFFLLSHIWSSLNSRRCPIKCVCLVELGISPSEFIFRLFLSNKLIYNYCSKTIWLRCKTIGLRCKAIWLGRLLNYFGSQVRECLVHHI